MFKITTFFGLPITYKSFVFNGGEVHVKIDDPTTVEQVDTSITIEANITNSNQIMELALLVDAIRRINPKIAINLLCPYLPYARQDRVCDSGEALAVKVMAGMLNALNFDSIELWDVHSDVSMAVLDRVSNVGPENFLSILATNRNYTLVSPDAGAMKKVGKVAKKFNMEMLTASKIRDTRDGSITGTQITLTESSKFKTFLIVDDICDGGRTFTELAKVIREQYRVITNGLEPRVELYVTHGIFSKGLKVLQDAGIDHVYTANLFPNVDTDGFEDYLTIVTK